TAGALGGDRRNSHGRYTGPCAGSLRPDLRSLSPRTSPVSLGCKAGSRFVQRRISITIGIRIGQKAQGVATLAEAARSQGSALPSLSATSQAQAAGPPGTVGLDSPGDPHMVDMAGHRD